MPERVHAMLRATGLGLAALWIFGVAIFYYIRFTFLVYAEHANAIDRLMARVTGLFGGGS